MAPPIADPTAPAADCNGIPTPSIAVPQKTDPITNGSVASSYPDKYFVATSEMAQLSLPADSVPYVSGSDSSPELPRRRQPSQRIADNTVMFDPWCDPANPRTLHFQDVCEAAYKIKSGIMSTPCTRSYISEECNMQLFFKKDYMQYTGSFKERGARYTLMMLTADQRKAGVVAASAGNHALALCYHGRELGVSVTVVMPIIAPIMKVQSCRNFGANVIVRGDDLAQSKEIAMTMAKEDGMMYINGYDHPNILAGQGTMGLEMMEQVSNLDAVVVPVGGGGLIAGVALAVKSLNPNVLVIGVESEKCASFSAAVEHGSPVHTRCHSTLADGLAVPLVGVNAFATAAPLIDKMVQVSEEQIAISILRLVEVEKAMVEGAGACGLAAILSGALPELRGKRVVVPLCGGNIDTTILGRCLERGLAAEGRLCKFTVTVSDRPGGIAELTRLLAKLGVSIKDIMHERAWIRNDIYSVEVKVVAETINAAETYRLRDALCTAYEFVRFGPVCGTYD
ncbi:L-threonine dehydratase catabolic TdcB-like [Amphibalanus amphitrite]|uniref:L-threonine dehydratase catabolic TdcB-like n=1 Tax=Amphibalanus amphitrite TaxID=1232801 RepID=UPI001C928979|nr:L-threonine dehydratase catabolic TdcB-like [Amphibalanus amphitrite]